MSKRITNSAHRHISRNFWTLTICLKHDGSIPSEQALRGLSHSFQLGGRLGGHLLVERGTSCVRIVGELSEKERIQFEMSRPAVTVEEHLAHRKRELVLILPLR